MNRMFRRWLRTHFEGARSCPSSTCGVSSSLGRFCIIQAAAIYANVP
jgi:hypothetical protein